MDTLKQQLLRIQQQLAALSASQKMLTGSLVAIMVMTLFYWSHYSGSAEQVPLIDQTLSADDFSNVKALLTAKGENFTVVGDKIMVSPDKQFAMLAELSYEQKLPTDMKTAFDEISDKMSPLDGSTRSEAFYNHAREQTLKRMIGAWPGVKSATVMINGVQKTSILHPIDPTATVDITLKQGESGSQKMADAARSCVSGAQSGLDAKNVKVVINGRTIEVSDPDSLASGDILGAQVNWEKHFADNIQSRLDYLGKVYSSVGVNVTTQTSDTEQRTVDPKQKVNIAIHETSSSHDGTQAPSGGEPGVVPNTGVNTDAAAAVAGTTDHQEVTETEYKADLGWTQQKSHAPPGSATATRAAVSVPESYFQKMWKFKNPSQQRDPTDDEIQALVKRETPRIREAVKAVTNIKDDDLVSVASFVDLDSIAPVEPAAGGLATMPVNVGFGAKEIAIGALAVISLFMVSMMVRKSAPQPQLAMAGTQPMSVGNALDALAADAPAIYDSEVSESGAMLTGHELSEEAIEAKSVIEQVDAMVKANPDAAANLIKRWMNAD